MLGDKRTKANDVRSKVLLHVDSCIEFGLEDSSEDSGGLQQDELSRAWPADEVDCA